MRQQIKYILTMLGLLLFMSSQSMGQSKWVPIMMGDITTFVPNTPSVQAIKDYYVPNATVTVNVQGYISGDGDWVGIYRKGTSTAWSNVVAWNWVSKNGTVLLVRDKKPMPAGEYEVRLFFHNNYDMKAFDSFVVRKYPISTVKVTYNANETVSVNVQMTLSGVEDYVGIYPKGSDNSWGNAINWNWVTKNGTVALTRGGNLMPAGEYEVRLFYRNEHGEDAVARATYGFSVSGGGNNNYEYGSEGPYLDKVRTRETNKAIIYYPEGHVQNAPLVLVVGYMDTIIYDGDNKGHRLEGIMTHLASLGCYVIGHKHITGGSAWSNTTDTVKRRAYFIDAVNEANNLGVDTSRLAVVGKSLGGMHAYALMKYFKGQGHGGEKSFVLDLMGWYALDMNKNDLELLDIDSLVLHYGGKTGVQTEYSQDPRTLITISKILKDNNNNVGFITLDTTNHSYEGGTYNDLKGKPKLLKPIDAMFRYEFFNSDGKYNNARNILFDNYDTTVQQSNDATINYIGQGTSRDKYGDLECSLINGIDYCNDHGL